MSELSTEEKILAAAISVFQEKGMNGARMQEIADKAGINKALLHYYYRSKQLLFEQVFKTIVRVLGPKLRSIINSDVHLFDKIRLFTHEYIDLLMNHMFLPAFIIQEINRNPDLIRNTFTEEIKDSVDILRKQINELIEKGEIKPIDINQIIVSLVSASIFPIVAKPIIGTIFNMDDKAYLQFLEERKSNVAEMIINSIKI